MKRVLILNSFIKQYTGSEIMTLELAKTFKELDFIVLVSGFEIGLPLINEYEKASIDVVNICNLPSYEYYDIIWAHHFITLEYCLLDKEIKADKVIFSSLSPYTALECPPFILDKISLFLANSSETKYKLVSMGIDKNIIRIFPNPVPSSFFHFRKYFGTSHKIKKIAIISNHLPQELLEFSQEAHKYQLSVDVIGFGFKEILVTPEILVKYDSVITIGKTAQYCLSLGIPVYCYDIFGGSGWISIDNIKKLEKYNFSGRDSNLKKDYIKINNEILNYKINYTELHSIADLANKNYNMCNLVRNIVEINLNHKIKITRSVLYSIAKRQREFYIPNILGRNFCQLFFKINNHFSEENSIRRRVFDNSMVDISFEIDIDEVFEFRFDPSNNPSFLSSLVVWLNYQDNTKEKVYNYNIENLMKLEDNDFLSLSNDPKIFFKVTQNKKITSINIQYFIYNNNLFEEKYQDYINNYEALKRNNSQLKQDLFEKNREISFLNKKNNALRKLYKKYKETIKFKDSYILELNNQNLTLLTLKRELSEKINDREREIRDLNIILTEIIQSRGYKMIMKVKKIFNKTDYDILKGSSLFDPKYYLNHNSDVREANIDPITHFLDYGWKEGRNPSGKFDINYYVESYPDVKSADINPLLHYIKYGKKERRKIKSVEIGKIPLIKNMLFLIKKNPSLINKFFFLVRSKGVRYALSKAKYKSNLQNNKKCNKREILLDELLYSLDGNYISKIEKFYLNKEIIKPIDIIIPIYNGYEFLYTLFESIKKNTTLPYRLLISDDRSPDERVVPFVEKFLEENPNIDVVFIKNKENLGFLKTVNLLSKYAENHLVLLNTDTEVPEFWLERLMYPIFKDNRIASTTPFTNSGTICSFPQYLIDNKDIYGNLTLEQVDSIFKLVNVDITMLEVPTGVGFCMGVNFNVVKKIGMFDEIYGKGYGEENDWCQRAIREGYKNVHITNLFVYHKHGGSFLSEDKIRYINEHYQILLSKFPTYDNQIQKVIKENELNGLRLLVRAIIDFKHLTIENVLIIDHELGGGANLYRKQKFEEMVIQGKGIIIFSYDITKNMYFLSFYNSDFNQRFTIEDNNLLLYILNFIDIKEILLNGVVSFPNVYEILDLILEIKERSNAKLVFPVHDYFCISPSYTLLTENNKYNGVPKNLEMHSKFLIRSNGEFKLFCKETNAYIWQEKWKHFLSSCDEILCFSHSSEDILLDAYSNTNIRNKLFYIPHDISGTFEKMYRGPENTGRVIGILGNINLPKGSYVIKELVEYIDNNNLNIKVVLIGNLDIEISSHSFVKTGVYQKFDVPNLLIKYKISEFLIPSIWPETYSYTTDEIMQLGYPITVFDLGAPAERVKLYNKGRIISLNSKNYIEEICQVWM